MIEKLPFGKQLKSYLESSEKYRLLKHSPPLIWLWRKFAKKQDAIIRKEDIFYRKLLNSLREKKHSIFDIGANTGWLSGTFLDFSEKVVAVEPDIFCQKLLTKKFGNRKEFILVPKAVSSEKGHHELLLHKEGSALNTLSQKWKKELEDGYFPEARIFDGESIKVETTTLDSLISEYGLPALAKVDVEGHELEVFMGLTKLVPLILFEANLPVFLEETKQVVKFLTALNSSALFNYTQGFEYKLAEFVPVEILLQRLEKIGKCSVDIICKMPNYPLYYEE